MSEQWMISNRQPWPEALLRGLISTKTRTSTVYLPPAGAIVYLHASKALWQSWRDLWWVEENDIDPRILNRGGIVGVARLLEKGPTWEIMPPEDSDFFICDDMGYEWDCAAEISMRFDDIRRLPFIPCRGAQVPTRKLPQELLDYLLKCQKSG